MSAWERETRAFLRDMAVILDGMNVSDELVRQIARHGYSQQIAYFVSEGARLAKAGRLTPPATVWTTEEILAREG